MIVMLLTYILALIFLIWMSNILNGQKTQISTSLDTVTMVLGAICQQGNAANKPIKYYIIIKKIKNGSSAIKLKNL